MKELKPVVLLFSLSIVLLSILFAYKINSGKEVVASKNIIIDSSRLHRLELDGKEDSLNADPVTKLADLKTKALKPADSTTLSWDLVDPEFRKSVVLVLEFESLDRFQQNCLDNFLKQNNIEFTKETESNSQIRLKTKEIQKANEIVEALATYDLLATLQILREPKPY